MLWWKRLERIERKLDKLMIDLTALQTKVTAENTVIDSAVTLLGGLSAEIKTLIAASVNTVDPVALQAIVDGIDAKTAALAAAVVANTPAGPPV